MHSHLIYRRMQCVTKSWHATCLFPLEYMKTINLFYVNSIHRLAFVFPVISTIAFAACSGVTGTAETHPTVNLQSAMLVASHSGDNLTISRQSYNPETHGFEYAWPFGPEYNPQ
jgi:hypothetical protein